MGPLRLKTGFSFFALLSSVFFATGSKPIYAQEGGSSYVGLSGGTILFSETEISGHDLDFDPGFVVAGSLGAVFGAVRTEGDVSLSQSDLRFGIDSEKLTVLRTSASLYVDFLGAGDANILPYAGGGIGVALLEFDDDIIGSDVALTGHGELGISFETASSVDLLFFYRFQHSETDLVDSGESLQSHQISVGIRFFR